MRRRQLIEVMSGVAPITVAGCVGSLSGGSDDSEPERQERVCTEAHITHFTWEGKGVGQGYPVEFNNRWIYYVDIENEAIVGGTVIVELEFWRSEDKDVFEGAVERSISIEAGEHKEEVIKITPRDEGKWASASISEQDCQYR